MTTTLPLTRPPRVQRTIPDLRPVHLEAAVPARDAAWALTVDGLVERPVTLAVDTLRAMPATERVWDFHCVWGWTRPMCRWSGIAVAELLEAARPLPGASHVVAACRQEPYASCMPLEVGGEALVAWALDGADLAPEHGAPIRLVQPPGLWGYKGVKWLGRLTVTDRLEPGFWEEKTGDVEGRVPDEVLAPFDGDDREWGPRPLDDVVAERRLKVRDCRACRNFEPSEEGLGYGWCPPHEQYVKLYHPEGTFFSQCSFKAIRRPKNEGLR